MNIAVGLVECRERIAVELNGPFKDTSGRTWNSGRYTIDSEVVLKPGDASASFALDDVTIGVGFHWQRNERQVFRGGLRVLKLEGGFTAINDVALEEYVTSVVSSEMSASCPIELLKAHAVISRSWLWFPKANPERAGLGHFERRIPGEITRWYGREAHSHFDVCADDHCQRYQGITKAFSSEASEAVRATSGQMLASDGRICDARFSKCCGGITELFGTAWDDWNPTYLPARFDGEAAIALPVKAEDWIRRADAPAFCNTRDKNLLAQILPGFDQETQDFYRWRVEYGAEEIRELVKSRLGVDLGAVSSLEPLERGPSGRIIRLRLTGSHSTVTISKELEIRRALSTTHLYSSAFVVEKTDSGFVLHGAGWGHGVGLCQIGAAVMASRGHGYRQILEHYYTGARV